MKKGLLLSLIASTAIFAGGDIAPVEPAAAAPAANCSDFSGNAGVHYRYDQATSTSTAYTTVTLAVEHQMGKGIGFGAEISGSRNLYNDAAANTAKLTQLYLTYAIGNTAVKAGRFALPSALSPLAYTGTTDGMKDTTFEGALIANTDIADTTLYAAYVYNTVANNVITNAKIVAVGVQYTGLANTTLGLVGYYDTIASAYKVAGKVDTELSGVKVSLIGAYAKGGDYGVSGKVAGSFDMFDWNLAATYAKGTTFTAGQFAKYTYTAVANDTVVEANVKAAVGPGKLYGKVAYTVSAKNLHARVGYKAPVWGNVTAGVEYRMNYNTTTKTASGQQVRVDVTYKF